MQDASEGIFIVSFAAFLSTLDTHRAQKLSPTNLRITRIHPRLKVCAPLSRPLPRRVVRLGHRPVLCALVDGLCVRLHVLLVAQIEGTVVFHAGYVLRGEIALDSVVPGDGFGICGRYRGRVRGGGLRLAFIGAGSSVFFTRLGCLMAMTYPAGRGSEGFCSADMVASGG